MKVYLGRILVVFLLATAVWVVIKDKSIFHINTVEIKVDLNETDRLAWAETNHQINLILQKYVGLSIWKISLREVKAKLQGFPMVRMLQIQKAWPNTLEVQYSLPNLKLIQQLGDDHYKILSSDGQWVGPIKWSHLPSLPWAKGDWINKKSDTKSNLLILLAQLPSTGPLAMDQISEIQYNDLDGFLLTLVKTGQQIRFGFENFELKSLRVTQVLEYLQSRGLESRVIDANFSKKVLVRLRNHP
jgi:cell division protein FtsQ